MQCGFGCFLKTNEKSINAAINYSAAVARDIPLPPAQLYGWGVYGLMNADEIYDRSRKNGVSLWASAHTQLVKQSVPTIIDAIVPEWGDRFVDIAQRHAALAIPEYQWGELFEPEQRESVEDEEGMTTPSPLPAPMAANTITMPSDENRSRRPKAPRPRRTPSPRTAPCHHCSQRCAQRAEPCALRLRRSRASQRRNRKGASRSHLAHQSTRETSRKKPSNTSMWLIVRQSRGRCKPSARAAGRKASERSSAHFFQLSGSLALLNSRINVGATKRTMAPITTSTAKNSITYPHVE